jgi:transcription elongation factor Elf1
MFPSMALPQDFSPRKLFQCPYCEARYAVIYTSTPTRDSGSAYCKVCRRRMSEWNAYTQPSYSLLDRGPLHD